MSELDLGVADHENLPPPDSDIQTPLKRAIANYRISLAVFDTSQPPTASEIWSILLARDAVHDQISQVSSPALTDVSELADCDRQLQSNQDTIATVGLLDEWRTVLNPLPERWWWFLSPSTAVSVLDKLDWLWNMATVAFLAGFAVNMTSVVPLLFTSGLGFLESLGLIGPSGLVALIASQLDKGKQSVSAMQHVLRLLGMPRRFQSEFTTLIALVLFTGAYLGKAHLPNYYFQHFVQKGQGFYQRGQLRKAKQAYEQALVFSEDESIKNIGKVHADLGIISESINENDMAIAHYIQALNDGEFNVLNNLGRVLLNQGKLLQAEAVLNMGLVRSNPEEVDTQYQFRRNLGWVYLKQERYNEAIDSLEQALRYQQEMSGLEPGYGIANCLKAAAHESQNPPQTDHAATQWQKCQRHARPETLSEYEVIIRHNSSLADTINTFAIFD